MPFAPVGRPPCLAELCRWVFRWVNLSTSTGPPGEQPRRSDVAKLPKMFKVFPNAA